MALGVRGRGRGRRSSSSLLTRRIADAPVEERPQLDFVGAVLSALGLALLVFGVLRSGEWGWIQPKPDGPVVGGPLADGLARARGPLRDLALLPLAGARSRRAAGSRSCARRMLRNRQLTGGLMMFFFQYLVQAGLFFVVPALPLGLPRALGARDRRAAAAALGHAAHRRDRDPEALPERLAAAGRPLRACSRCSSGTLVLLAALDADAGPEIVFVPMLLIGLGIGALASQLGAVTVSAVPDDQSPEVGGVQNTMTNLGASMGTALAGSIMIAAVTSAFIANIQQSPAIPDRVKAEAQVELAGGVPFVSDADLEAALDEARVDRRDDRRGAGRLRGRAASTGSARALAILALLVLVALFFAQRIPTTQPGEPPRSRRRRDGRLRPDPPGYQKSMAGTIDARLSLPATALGVRAARSAVDDVVRRLSTDDELRRDVRLCVSEAVTNVVRHAYDGAETGRSRSRCCTRGARSP